MLAGVESGPQHPCLRAPLLHSLQGHLLQVSDHRSPHLPGCRALCVPVGCFLPLLSRPGWELAPPTPMIRVAGTESVLARGPGASLMDKLSFALKLEPELRGPVPLTCRQRDRGNGFSLLRLAPRPSQGNLPLLPTCKLLGSVCSHGGTGHAVMVDT